MWNPRLIIEITLIIFYVNFSLTNCEATPNPQLDLPPLPDLNQARPQVLPNSYTANTNDNYNNNNNNNQRVSNYDQNRSSRYGPPYANNEDEEKFYANKNVDDGLYNRNQQPFSFNDQDRYNNNNNRYNDDERYRSEQERRQNQREMEVLRQALTEIDRKSSLECSLNVQSQWNFETNVNEITQAEALASQQRYSDFQRAIWTQMKRFDSERVQLYDPQLYRQFQLMSIIGPNALAPDSLDRYNRLINDMLAIYNGASICAFEQPFNCGLRLQPQLKEIMAKSRDWEELQYVWTEFRRRTGRDMRDLFEQMVDLTNEAAHLNNFTNGETYWSFPYDSDSFREEMETAWSEVQSLYELLHSYVRRKLREFYGPDKISRDAPLPDHVFGNMYGQSWSNILDIIIPYPGRSFVEVTPAMQQQGFTPEVMFNLAEEFFISINMSAMPQDFLLHSIIEQPLDRSILCSPSAWDFCNRHDYRIKMCTQVTHRDLITVHHEMAHVQYFLNYRHQPRVFRDGANPGFHEAIGDAIALSVSTPKHLQTLGLIHKSTDDTAHEINYLFAMAMDKVVFLPFALALDVWRYDVFSKRIRKEQYNCHWWILREKYGGVKPPVLRSEMDFDPGSKYHVPANIPYSRYFVGAILQFQIHRALCRASRQYDPEDPSKPLHKCDIHRQPEAGNLLKRIMEKGASQPWHEVLQEVTGEGRLDGSALREFFRPLEEWLRNENLRNQEYVGWNYDGDYCKHSIETANLQVYGGFYNNAPLSKSSNWLLQFTSIAVIISSAAF